MNGWGNLLLKKSCNGMRLREISGPEKGKTEIHSLLEG